MGLLQRKLYSISGAFPGGKLLVQFRGKHGCNNMAKGFAYFSESKMSVINFRDCICEKMGWEAKEESKIKICDEKNQLLRKMCAKMRDYTGACAFLQKMGHVIDMRDCGGSAIKGVVSIIMFVRQEGAYIPLGVYVALIGRLRGTIRLSKTTNNRILHTLKFLRHETRSKPVKPNLRCIANNSSANFHPIFLCILDSYAHTVYFLTHAQQLRHNTEILNSHIYK